MSCIWLNFNETWPEYFLFGKQVLYRFCRHESWSLCHLQDILDNTFYKIHSVGSI